MLARLEAARLRCGLLPVSGERRAELRGMGLVEMLHASRRRVAEARQGEGDSDPAWGRSAMEPGAAER
jgi:hypothetical protein